MTTVSGNGTAMGGLGGPAGFGETMVPRADDASLRVDLSAVFEDGFRFGSTSIAANQVFVSTNGLVTFGGAFNGVASRLAAISSPFIAAFHADVDTRLDGEGPESGPVWIDVDAARDVVSFTWQEVGYYRRDARVTNTFQLQLYDRGSGAFDIVLRYESIGWTSGARQGGWNGTGGDAALVGWRLGPAEPAVSHWASGDENRLLGLSGQAGNTGVNGLWVYQHVPPRVTAGSAGADVLNGSAAEDLLYGGAGNDTLRGSGGADLLDGGAGFDIADFALSPAGVTVWLIPPGQIAGGDAAGDRLISIEGVIGSAYADRLAGDHGDNLLEGNAGNDTLFAHDGRDRYFGGAGHDRLDFAAAPVGILLDLADPERATGHAAGDFLDSIEEFAGSAWADTLAGADASDLLYGAAGNDLLQGRAGNDRLFGEEGDDRLNGDEDADLLSGGSGRDTAEHTDATAAVWADLSDPSRNMGDAAGDIYVSIENLGGSAFNDTLAGDAGDNLLQGRGGDDRLSGRAGADMLSGDAGNDTLEGGDGPDLFEGGTGFDQVSYADQAGPVRVDLLNPQDNRGAAAEDRFSGIEAIEGGLGADSLFGDSAANTLIGSDGADQLEGRGGADLLLGGRGMDLASYRTATGPVVADLAQPLANRGDAAGDRFVSVENLRGSSHDDDLRGDAGRNRLTGGAGNDRLSGAEGDDLLQGNAGSDQLFGGAGLDVASYAGARQGVTANLATPGNNTGEARGDRYDSIEGLIGSAFADWLTGDDGANRLSGGRGNDRLSGAAGQDWLTGGAGADQFVLARLRDAGDVVTDYTPAQGDRLILGLSGLSRDDLAVEFDAVSGLGQPGRAEALLIHRPTGTILFTLLDAADLSALVVQIGAARYDLL